MFLIKISLANTLRAKANGRKSSLILKKIVEGIEAMRNATSMFDFHMFNVFG